MKAGYRSKDAGKEQEFSHCKLTPRVMELQLPGVLTLLKCSQPLPLQAAHSPTCGLNKSGSSAYAAIPLVAHAHLYQNTHPLLLQ